MSLGGGSAYRLSFGGNEYSSPGTILLGINTDRTDLLPRIGWDEVAQNPMVQ